MTTAPRPIRRLADFPASSKPNPIQQWAARDTGCSTCNRVRKVIAKIARKPAR